MLQAILIGPSGARFLADCKAANRPVYLWTVNEEEWMEWSIRKDVDGVCTDNSKVFLEVCDRWKGMQVTRRSKPMRRTGLRRWTKLYANVAFIHVMVTIFFMISFMKSGSPRTQVRKAMAA